MHEEQQWSSNVSMSHKNS